MSMIEVKTAELIGPALDWAVAKAEGKTVSLMPTGLTFGKECGHPCRYSTSWSQGGPLIERHKFDFDWVDRDWHGDPLKFFTACGYDLPASSQSSGPTHLIAACRAIVLAKLGDVVSVPAELIKAGERE